MALTKLKFRPGINRDISSYSNENGWLDGNKIRFRLGYPEKIGGWEKYSGSNFLGTAGSWSASQNNGATGETQLVATSGATLFITGVQLEAGTSASDFEFLPVDVNLNRCLRYYYQDTGYLDITVMRVSDSSRAVHKTLPVPMRTTPTFTPTSSNEIGNTSMNNSSDKSVRFSMSGSADNAPRYQAYNFSAEL